MAEQSSLKSVPRFAAIFDLDGVIVDTRWAHQKAVKRLCEDHGRVISADEFNSRVFGRRNYGWIPEFFGRDLQPADVERLSEEKEARFRDAFAPRAAPLKGLRNFLDSLRDHGIPIAVATTAPAVNVEFILHKTKLAGRFAVVLHAASVSVGKPDPQIYLLAARELGLSAARCVVFEDSLPGIEAARRAGSKVVGVATMHELRELEARTDMPIRDFVGLTVAAIQDLWNAH